MKLINIILILISLSFLNENEKDCSEYKGTNEYTCMNNYDSQDKDKKCFMENGHCIEKYIYCENYTGTNAAIVAQ